jgi:hypothetical protein
MVRAKMRLGRQASFTAVYAGSTEAQRRSENAIFGDATPAGNFYIYGAVPEFQAEREYYLDLMAPGESAHEGAVLALNLRKIYRSEPDPNRVTTHALFRFTVTDGLVAGSLDMSIANPAATERLDDSDVWRLLIQAAE